MKRMKLSVQELDEIAKNDGFPIFIKQLDIDDKRLYSNDNYDRYRVYDLSKGAVIVEYSPKQNKKPYKKFNHPLENNPNNVLYSDYRLKRR